MINLKLSLLFFSCLLISGLAVAELEGVDPDKLQEMADRGALVVDIRTEKEWQSTGIISSSQKLMFYDEDGEYNADQWLAQLRKLKSSVDQPVIVVCHSGGRSSSVGKYLNNKIGMPNVYHLENGISGWIKQGKTTDK